MHSGAIILDTVDHIQLLRQQCDAICNRTRDSSVHDEQSDVFGKMLRLINIRDRSSVELHDRLTKDYDESTVDAAIKRAQGCGLLDDIRFAEALIRTRISACKGQCGIEFELEKHGIDPSSIKGWPHDFFGSEEQEANRALALLRKRPPTSKNKRDGAYRRLVQKGFSSDISVKAARLWVQEVES